jgi:hypothetical protein
MPNPSADCEHEMDLQACARTEVRQLAERDAFEDW